MGIPPLDSEVSRCKLGPSTKLAKCRNTAGSSLHALGQSRYMQPKRLFFDPTLIEQSGAAFIRESKVDEALTRLIPGARISKGRFSYPATAEQRDLVWNHMDQNHRPLVHRTYGEAMRVFIGEPAAFSLTRFGSWPAVIPVFDGYYGEGGFYQVVCLFGLLVVVNTIECKTAETGTSMEIDWAIASHWSLRFLHPLLSKRLMRLNLVQNAEDDEIRDRRVALRAAGYRFLTDTPNFINANALRNNVVFPAVSGTHSVALDGIADGEVRRLEVAGRAYILRRAGDGFDVWPGVCPHEGAALTPKHLCDGIVECPWHGLKYGLRRMGRGDAAIVLCGARLEVDGQTLRVMSTAGGDS